MKKKFLIIKCFFGEFNDLLSLSVFKDFFNSLGSSSYHHGFFDFSNYNDSNFNLITQKNNFNFIKQSDCILLIGSNPRFEAPILNV